MNSRLTSSPAWKNLLKHQEELSRISLTDVILNDPQRLENCELILKGLRLVFAFHRVTSKTIDLLSQLATQEGLEQWRTRLFRGDKINTSEQRAALHTALRQTSDQPVLLDGRDIIQDVKQVRQRMRVFIDDLTEGRWRGATGKPIRHVINIGIGGSDLGPRLAARALTAHAVRSAPLFVANLDAFDIVSALKNIDPAETLFVIVSKTFTTLETRRNAETARQWLVDRLGPKAIEHHFIAVTANQNEGQAFGIPPCNMFPMWEWVGGRFSLWSAVGLSAAITLGMDNFEKMCDGAATMDQHFLSAPLQKNMPVILALLDIWNRNLCHINAHAVLPYSERLRDLPRYLQQLEMESNGKSTTRDGMPTDYATAPLIFGESGTVGQHSFYQWLHQGYDIVASDFIGVKEDDLNHPGHHRPLLANMLAQAGALAFGHVATATTSAPYAGGRPSNLIILERLDPFNFGMLLALYEHKVFVQSVIWGINCFDQPGVELGKSMAVSLESASTPTNRKDAFFKRFLDLPLGVTTNRNTSLKLPCNNVI
jgi:glucose-6-phosphate isomerase